MSERKHAARVGVFVLTGVLLLVLGVLALGGRKYFNEDAEFVLYFDGSVNGLAEGAPVVFRGVPLGSVSHISLVAGADMSHVVIPVRIHIDAGAIRNAATGTPVQNEDTRSVVADMVRNGMKGRLSVANMITGQSRIELDFMPDAPARFHTQDHASVIPTLPSPVESLQRSLSKVPVQRLVTSIEDILLRIHAIVASGEIERSLTAFADACTSANVLLLEMQTLPPHARKILASGSAVASSLERETPATLATARTAMEDLASAVREFKKIADGASGMLGQNAKVAADLQVLLREIAAASRSLRGLTDSLERNPEALIRGRKGAY